MKYAFKVVVLVHEKGTRFPMREHVIVVTRTIPQAADRAEKHIRAIYKRRSIPVRVVEAVGAENLGQAIT